MLTCPGPVCCDNIHVWYAEGGGNNHQETALATIARYLQLALLSYVASIVTLREPSWQRHAFCNFLWV